MTGLSDKQEKSLRLFVELVKKLLDSPVLKNGKKTVGTLMGTAGDGSNELVTVFDGHSEGEFMAFVTTFRQFTMPKEQAVHFGKVCAILTSNCQHPNIKGWVKYAEDAWQSIMSSVPVVGIQIDGSSLSNEELLKLWLYGGAFHTDIDKAEKWESLGEHGKSDAMVSIQAMTPKLVNCLVTVGSVVEKWLNDPGADVPETPPAP